MMKRSAAVVMLSVSSGTSLAGDFKLPTEVTHALRSACESDVRRMCIKDDSTVASVRDCMLSKFTKLGKRCQLEIASAGLAP